MTGSPRATRFETVGEFVGVVRFEWSVRHVWQSRRALLRGLWWTFGRRYPGELCEDCGRPVAQSIGHTFWRADDALWKRVVGTSHGTLCVADFTRRADRFGINIFWRPDVF